jgi:hypothetical protein
MLQAGTLMKTLRASEKVGGIKYTGISGTMNAKMVILQAKSQYDAVKNKHKERAERRNELRKQRKLENQLEDHSFPTIMVCTEFHHCQNYY